MDPATLTGLASLLDLASRATAFGLLVFFVVASAMKKVVWGYQLEEAKAQAAKWEKYYLDSLVLTDRAVSFVEATQNGRKP